MHVVYMDDSYDSSYPSKGHSVAFVIVKSDRIEEIEMKFKEYRASLFEYGYQFPNIEFHGSPLFSGKNPYRRINEVIRQELYISFMELVSRLPLAVIIGCTSDGRMKRRLIERSISRVGKCITVNGGHEFMLVCDKGSENIIFSEQQYYKQSTNQKTFLIDPPLFTDSKHCDLIQVADMIAYTIYRDENKINSTAEWRKQLLSRGVDIIESVLVKQAFSKDKRGLGIVRTY